MKNLFYFSVVCLLTFTGIANGQKSNNSPSFPSKPETILLDSIYIYNWPSSDWFLNIKNYFVKDSKGRTIQNFYKKYNSDSAGYLNYARFLYNYQGTSVIPATETRELWFAPDWNTFQYTHYIKKDLPDTTFHKVWDPQHHKFGQGLKNTYLYNDSLQPLENITQLWDTTALDWINTLKNTYTYTASMKPADQILLSWQLSTSTWKNVYKYSDVYDGNDLLVNHFEYQWNDTASTWDNTIRISYYNNGVAMPYLTVEELWNLPLNRWDSVFQTANIYNQYYWLMAENTQVYMNYPGRWVENYFTSYGYSPSGAKTNITGSVYDTIHNNWVVNSYQAFDSLTRKVSEKYNLNINLATFLAIGGTRYVYSYKPSGDTLSAIHTEWDVPGAAWVNNSQALYTYDLNGMISEELDQTWPTAGSSWVNSKKTDYFYSDFIGINELSAINKPCIYANPVKAGNSIYCPDFTAGNDYILRVYSLSGTLVNRIPLKGGQSVIIPQSLSPGLYFLTIEEGNKVVYKDKIVVVN